MWKKVIIAVVVLAVIGTAALFSAFQYFGGDLPRMITVNDYHPLLVSANTSRHMLKPPREWRR